MGRNESYSEEGVESHQEEGTLSDIVSDIDNESDHIYGHNISPTPDMILVINTSILVSKYS